ncbi:UvrD-helicase domain-containing protein [Neptunomonas concharum]|uniref:DNA 3'-5' helicase II n=1 Tax=Neptunomonas concharum TaxID=1031538 RepID=A0A5P1RBR1_9GAMM|nr:UvrD-helicase domain-containing protein [Neptunomonas concharum]QEQ96701.1 ATP-dependent helicase [Neptunomonas concharum]
MVSKCLVGLADTDVDLVISHCLNPVSPHSFFLYAGAGSGKTYSLVKALEAFEKSYGEEYRREGRKLAVITYTNAACDEITERVKGNPLFHISTIHSFCWILIKSFHDGIREYLLSEIPIEILELEKQEAKGRGGKASEVRRRKIADKKKYIEWLNAKKVFTYNPNGDNQGMASLSHSQVIKICSYFLVAKPSFQQILVSRYPFMLIDESQDTNKDFIEALFEVEKRHETFALGLIGDMMQRIYGDGKADLGAALPEGWANPIKHMNWRSPSRIVSLANDIRHETDQQIQKVPDGKPEGFVRLFIANSDIPNKPQFEVTVERQMAEITGDELWNNQENTKHLMLEHKMAAKRMNFEPMYSALSKSSHFQTGLRSGELTSVRVFSEYVHPLYKLVKEGMSHAVMTHLRRTKSPLISKEYLQSQVATTPLQPVREAIQKLVELIDSDPKIAFLEILQCVATHNLFSIPHSLVAFIDVQFNENKAEEESDLNEADDSSIEALLAFLKTPYQQIEAYSTYVSGEGAFDTHQGVKGREFERVLVVMDDEDAGGFLFSYEKLFGVQELTKRDRENITSGKESGVDRTRRLFYVTCTRAEKSLALVAYTRDPSRLKQSVLSKGWFIENEIVMQ